MIDWNRIAELRGEICDDGFAEVLGLFFEDADDAVAKLQSTSDPVLLAEVLHSLKGSAQNLGLSEVSTLCLKEETRLVRADATLIDTGSIVTALMTARRELQNDSD